MQELVLGGRGPGSHLCRQGQFWFVVRYERIRQNQYDIPPMSLCSNGWPEGIKLTVGVELALHGVSPDGAEADAHSARETSEHTKLVVHHRE